MRVRWPWAVLAIPLFVVAPVPGPTEAQVSEPSSVEALRISESIDIDGWLSEAAWGRAVRISNFTQREMTFGEPASERTEVAVLFDAEALYVGFWGFDGEPGRIFANEMARDFSWSGDDNFERNIRRKREQVLWQGWSRDFNLEQVSRAGTMTGLGGLGSVRLVDVRPHGLTGVEWNEGEDRSSVGHLGLDVHYLPSPAWRVNFTVNPDFAQVESDREQVNLSRFSLFYPEKREFFLEGQEFFEFEVSSDSRPFCGRRIGLAADRTEVPIIGGGRALGKWSGTTLGAMILQTAEDGDEPSTNFGVFRWKQDVLDESAVGALLVSRLESGRQNLTYGVDLTYATSEMFDEKEFEAGLVLAQTHTSDAREKTGLAHRLYVGYPNDLVEFSASWTRADDAFNPEAGYIRRSSYQRFESELAILPRPDFLPFIQQFEFKPWELSYYKDDITGELQSFYSEFVPLSFTTRTGESLEFAVTRRAERLEEPFELFEDAEIPEGEYWYTRWLLDLSSFSARKVSGSVEMGWGEFYLGKNLSVSSSGRWKVNKHLTLRADYGHNRITFGGDSFLVDEVGPERILPSRQRCSAPCRGSGTMRTKR